jgi:hypothetical protein
MSFFSSLTRLPLIYKLPSNAEVNILNTVGKTVYDGRRHGVEMVAQCYQTLFTSDILYVIP